MTYEAMKELLGISELYTVTRERIEQELETVLSMVDEGQSPILITDDGKPDLLLFSWEDYKRRFLTARKTKPWSIRRPPNLPTGSRISSDSWCS